MRLEWVRAADYLSEFAALDGAQGAEHAYRVDQRLDTPQRRSALAGANHGELPAVGLLEQAAVTVPPGHHPYARLRDAVAVSSSGISSSCGEPLSPENVPGFEEAKRKSRLLRALPLLWTLLCTGAAALLLELWSRKSSITQLFSGP
jgi:hypothetical protein